MSRIGLLADVHANLPALRTALRALEEVGVDRVLVAGDLVGYGASPDACVELLAEASATCVAGNHDLLVVGRLAPTRFPTVARRAASLTTDRIGRDTQAFLEALPLVLHTDGIVMAHGSLDDPEEYVQTADRGHQLLSTVMERFPGATTLVLGHTHHPWHLRGTRRGDGVRRRLINPGSVGQSRAREREPHVRLAVLDGADVAPRFLRLPYEVEVARADLRACGLSELGLHHPPPWTSVIGDRLPPRARTWAAARRRQLQGARS